MWNGEEKLFHRFQIRANPLIFQETEVPNRFQTGSKPVSGRFHSGSNRFRRPVWFIVGEVKTEPAHDPQPAVNNVRLYPLTGDVDRAGVARKSKSQPSVA